MTIHYLEFLASAKEAESACTDADPEKKILTGIRAMLNQYTQPSWWSTREFVTEVRAVRSSSFEDITNDLLGISNRPGRTEGGDIEHLLTATYAYLKEKKKPAGLLDNTTVSALQGCDRKPLRTALKNLINPNNQLIQSKDELYRAHAITLEGDAAKIECILTVYTQGPARSRGPWIQSLLKNHRKEDSSLDAEFILDKITERYQAKNDFTPQGDFENALTAIYSIVSDDLLRNKIALIHITLANNTRDTLAKHFPPLPSPPPHSVSAIPRGYSSTVALYTGTESPGLFAGLPTASPTEETLTRMRSDERTAPSSRRSSMPPVTQILSKF